MSIKDKIAIILTIFIVIVCGFILKGRAADVTVVSNLDQLANKATYSRDSFLSIDQSDLKGKYISQGNNKAIFYKGAMCMYHMQSTRTWGDKSKYYIYHVLDFGFENGDLVLENNRRKSN